MDRIYIVDADCDDQAQHTCDEVVAGSREEAEQMVIKARPYLDESTVNAKTVDEEIANLKRAICEFEKLTVEDVRKEWADMLDEEGQIS